MGDLARTAVTAAAVAGGLASGYLAERRVLRSRLAGPVPPPGPPLGAIEGRRSQLAGPDGVRVAVETYGHGAVPGDGDAASRDGDGAAGDGAAPTLVLVHGWTMTGRIWHEQVAALADRFRIVTYDQPGHGHSSPPRSGTYSMDLLGDTLPAVVDDHVEPGAPIVLVGHSLGGMVVLNALRRHPDLVARTSAAVLLSTTSGSARDGVRLGLGVHTLARLEGPLGRLRTRLPRRLTRLTDTAPVLAQRAASRAYRASSDLSFVLTRFVALSPEADPRYVDFTEQLVLDSDLDMIRGLTGPVLTLDEDEGLAALPAASVIVTGDRDHLVSPDLSRRMARRRPDLDLRVLPGVGHMTLLEAHGAVNALLERLLTTAAPDVAAPAAQWR